MTHTITITTETGNTVRCGIGHIESGLAGYRTVEGERPVARLIIDRLDPHYNSIAALDAAIAAALDDPAVFTRPLTIGEIAEAVGGDCTEAQARAILAALVEVGFADRQGATVWGSWPGEIDANFADIVGEVAGRGDWRIDCTGDLFVAQPHNGWVVATWIDGWNDTVEQRPAWRDGDTILIPSDEGRLRWFTAAGDPARGGWVDAATGAQAVPPARSADGWMLNIDGGDRRPATPAQVAFSLLADEENGTVLIAGTGLKRPGVRRAWVD